MELTVTPEGLQAASAQVAALTGRLLGANVAHAVVGTAIVPPGADPVSIKTALTLVGQTTIHQAAAAVGTEEMARSSVGVAETGTSYLLGDTLGAAALGAAGGFV